jgi:carbon monoxide dehydrogenase subunit G
VALDVEQQLIIDRPRRAVASFAMEPENDTRWIGGISQARRLTRPPTGIGTRVERVASFLGRRIDYLMEVVDHEPEHRIVMQSIKSPFPMRVTYSFEGDGSATTARVRVQGEPGGFYRLTGPLMAGAVKRSLRRDLDALRTIMEAQEPDAV